MYRLPILYNLSNNPIPHEAEKYYSKYYTDIRKIYKNSKIRNRFKSTLEPK